MLHVCSFVAARGFYNIYKKQIDELHALELSVVFGDSLSMNQSDFQSTTSKLSPASSSSDTHQIWSPLNLNNVSVTSNQSTNVLRANGYSLKLRQVIKLNLFSYTSLPGRFTCEHTGIQWTCLQGRESKFIFLLIFIYKLETPKQI